MVEHNKTVILGAGISALASGYYLKKSGVCPILLEKDDTYGGLCSNFEIDGFLFDRFIHLSFSENEDVNAVFASSGNVLTHVPNPYNIYKGIWIKHPAQNNTYPLSADEKTKIIDDFKKRPPVDLNKIHNYEEWLRVQYGDYFAENFPIPYTRKYWMCEASELETKWAGGRLYQPSIDEVVKGSETSDTPITYYAKEMRYPEKGGYKSFLNKVVEGLNIHCNSKVVSIDTASKIVTVATGKEYSYDTLISSLPLTEIVGMLKDVPSDVLDAFCKLKYTSGYLVSVGLKTKEIPPYLWWYVYDEDILPARIYSPSMKSPNNAPEGCSSLQMEIYCDKSKYTEEELYNGSVQKLLDMKIIKEEDILFTNIRFEKYANIVFDHHIYEAREIVKIYLESLGINLIGRFGEWDYLWSDQSFLSGKNIVPLIK